MTVQKHIETKGTDPTIRFQVIVGVTNSGDWCIAGSGRAVPLSLEDQIDEVWEDIRGNDDMGDGYEIYVLNVELPRPVRHRPPQARPSSASPARRVDSKDAILRGRQAALLRVLRLCKLGPNDTEQVTRMLNDLDSHWEEDQG